MCLDLQGYGHIEAGVTSYPIPIPVPDRHHLSVLGIVMLPIHFSHRDLQEALSDLPRLLLTPALSSLLGVAGLLFSPQNLL